jgi:hypothetical protein
MMKIGDDQNLYNIDPEPNVQDSLARNKLLT